MVLKIPFSAILEMEQNPVSGRMTIVVDINRMNTFGGEFEGFPPFPFNPPVRWFPNNNATQEVQNDNPTHD